MKSLRLLLAAATLWLLANGPLASADTLLDVSSSLTLSDPTQLGRLSRDAIASIWSETKTFPGIFNNNTSFHYRTLSVFSPLSAQFAVNSRYVQVTLVDSNAALFVSAYLDSFTPNPAAPNRGLDVNYLGDPGLAGNTYGVNPACFQIFVPAGHNLIVVVNDILASNGGIGKPFRLLVEGFTDTLYSDTRPGIVSFAFSKTNVVLNATNGIAGRTYALLTSTNAALPLSQWPSLATKVPLTNGLFNVSVTNTPTPLDPQRFFILRSPTE